MVNSCYLQIMIHEQFRKFSHKVAEATGTPLAFGLALILIILWAFTGPTYHYSENWQLVINTSTTIITFIMVFIIQHSQNKDTTAIQLKLNELIAANKLASNRLVNSEELTEKELDTLKLFYKKLSNAAEEGKDLFTTHSVDEARGNQQEKNSLQ